MMNKLLKYITDNQYCKCGKCDKIIPAQYADNASKIAEYLATFCFLHGYTPIVKSFYVCNGNTDIHNNTHQTASAVDFYIKNINNDKVINEMHNFFKHNADVNFVIFGNHIHFQLI
jgi:archaellum component FlaG (FlaF/FlaG flagellin family)